MIAVLLKECVLLKYFNKVVGLQLLSQDPMSESPLKLPIFLI